MPARPPASPAQTATDRPDRPPAPQRPAGELPFAPAPAPRLQGATAPACPDAARPERTEPSPPSRWQPTNWRTRIAAALLALALATAVLWEAVQPKLALMNARAARGEAPVPMGLPTEGLRDAERQARCRAQPQAPGCVGAPMPILVLPARAPDGAASR